MSLIHISIDPGLKDLSMLCWRTQEKLLEAITDGKLDEVSLRFISLIKTEI